MAASPPLGPEVGAERSSDGEVARTQELRRPGRVRPWSAARAPSRTATPPSLVSRLSCRGRLRATPSSLRRQPSHRVPGAPVYWRASLHNRAPRESRPRRRARVERHRVYTATVHDEAPGPG